MFRAQVNNGMMFVDRLLYHMFSFSESAFNRNKPGATVNNMFLKIQQVFPSCSPSKLIIKRRYNVQRIFDDIRPVKRGSMRIHKMSSIFFIMVRIFFCFHKSINAESIIDDRQNINRDHNCKK